MFKHTLYKLRIWVFLWFFLLIVGNQLQAQTTKNLGTPNLSFEYGDFTNWTIQTGYYHYNTTLNDYEYVWTQGNRNERLKIMSGIGDQDPIVACSNLYTNPEGYSAIRLGLPTECADGQYITDDGQQRATTYDAYAEKASYKFTVTRQTTLLFFQFACVLKIPQNDNHTGKQYPTFGINIIIRDPKTGEYSTPLCTSIKRNPNEADNNLTRVTGRCNQSIVNGQCHASSQLSDFVYNNWSTAAVDLSNHIGKELTIEVYNNDCLVLDNNQAGSHGSHGYFTAETRTLEFNIRNCEGEDAVITAPSGFTTYTWSRSDGAPISFKDPTGVDRTAVVVDQSSLNPNTHYTCQLTTGTNCGSIVMDTVLNTIRITPQFDYQIDCGGKVHFTNTSLCENDELYAYQWNFGDGAYSTETNPQHLYSTPGSKTITLTAYAKSGCSKTMSMPINVPVYPVPQITGEANVCSSTQLNLFVDGVTAGCTYEWRSDSINGPIVGYEQAYTGLADKAKTYYVTVTDANHCVYKASKYILVRESPNVQITGDSAVCVGSSTTLVARNASSYQWEAYGTNANIVVTPLVNPTTYTVVGYSSNGCSATASFEIKVNNLPEVSIGGLTELCAGSSTQLTASGATSYRWDNYLSTDVRTISSDTAGKFYYSVTGTDHNGCKNTDQIAVTFKPLPELIYSGDTELCVGKTGTYIASGANQIIWDDGSAYGLEGNKFSCKINHDTVIKVAGITDGCTSHISIPVSTKLNPYVYIMGPDALCLYDTISLKAYSNGGQNIHYQWNDTNLSRTESIEVSPLNKTTYVVTGTADNGCTADARWEVAVNPLPVPVIQAPDKICLGDQVSLHASGANTYVWNKMFPGESYTVTLVSDSTFTVDCEDINGCKASTSRKLTVSALPSLSYTGETSVCLGESVRLTAAGASSYLWHDGNTTNTHLSTPTQNTTYTLTGTYQGCSATLSIPIVVKELPSVYITGKTVLCMGDSVVLYGHGASSYQWSDLAQTQADSLKTAPTSNTTYLVTGTANNGCQNTATIDLMVNPLPKVKINAPATACQQSEINLTVQGATTYLWNHFRMGDSYRLLITKDSSFVVTGVDINQCRNTDSVFISVVPKPQLQILGETTVCRGQQVVLQVSGAKEYQWQDGSTESYYITTPLQSETYTVTGSSDGCSSSLSLPITVRALPVVQITGTPEICMFDTASITVHGNATNYLWNTADTAAVLFKTPLISTRYIVTGTGNNGCSNADSFTVIVNELPHITIEGEHTLCYQQFAKLSASGAVQYVWQNAVAGSSIYPQIVSDTVFSVTGYSSKGCKATQTHSIRALPLPQIEVSGAEPVCENKDFTVRVSGASSYRWQDGSTEDYFAGKAVAGTQLWVVGTLNGCQSTRNIHIETLPIPYIWVDGQKNACIGDTLHLSAKGAKYYQWSNGETTDVLNIAPNYSNRYSVSGTDENGCANTYSFDITIHQLPLVNITGDEDICRETVAHMQASGAVSYQWDDALGTTGEILNIILSTDQEFTVIGTDEHGCSNTAKHFVLVVQEPEVDFTGDTLVCTGQPVILSGQGADSYRWQYGSEILSNEPVLTMYPQSSQMIRLYGSTLRCTNYRDIRLLVKSPPTVHITGNTEVCPGIAFRLAASGADHYTWNTGDTTAIISDSILTTQRYLVTGTSLNGCTGTDVITVDVHPITRIHLASNHRRSCPLEPDTVILSASKAHRYLWSSQPYNSDVAMNSNANLLLTYNEPLLVVVNGYDDFGCATYADSVDLQVLPRDTIAFEVSPNYIEEGSSEVRLIGLNPSTGSQWTWDMGDESPLRYGNNLTHNYQINGVDSFLVSVSAVDAYGCVYSGETTVHTWRDFWAPTAFSPNGDDLNDSFGFIGEDYFVDFHFMIYNRNNEIVYTGNHINDRWDGQWRSQPCPMGVYGWRVEYRSLHQGVEKTGKKKGFVTLVR